MQSPSKITKNNSQGIISVIISCQRVVSSPEMIYVYLGRDYHQSFAQPDVGAEKKNGLSADFLLIFLCLRPKRVPEKSARNPGYQ